MEKPVYLSRTFDRPPAHGNVSSKYYTNPYYHKNSIGKAYFPIFPIFLGSKNTVGELFNPGLNCSDILDKSEDNKDGFYWITLKLSNPVKVELFCFHFLNLKCG